MKEFGIFKIFLLVAIAIFTWRGEKIGNRIHFGIRTCTTKYTLSNTHIVFIDGILGAVVSHPFDNIDEIADKTRYHALQNTRITAQYEFVDYSSRVKLFDH